MKAIVVTDRAVGSGGMTLVERTEPQAAIIRRVRDGRLRTKIGNISTLEDAVAALNPSKRIQGKTIIRVRT